MRRLRVDALAAFPDHPGMSVRVLLGDAHRSFVEAMALRLDAEAELEVVAVASRPEEALNAVRAKPVDVAVLAVGPEPGGFVDIGRQLLKRQPELKLIAVAAEDDTALLARAVSEGFRGWVSKDVGIAALLDVIHAVGQGETSIPPRILSQLLPYILQEAEERRAAEAPLAMLTAREREVLKAMVNGQSRQEIAEALTISSNTVRTHMQNILAKLGVHSSLAAVAIARRAGLN
jgi:DNA-binding NarL/FixJ family response regulator